MNFTTVYNRDHNTIETDIRLIYLGLFRLLRWQQMQIIISGSSL